MQAKEFIKKIKKIFSNNYVILTTIFLLITISNIIWLKIDTRPPHWDASNHLMHSLAKYDLLKEFSLRSLKHFYGSYTYYPPAYYWATSFFYLLFGKGVDIAVYTNIFFLFILIFSTYGIAKHFWGRGAGLLSALVVSVMPVLLSQSREYQLDFPLTAMVALTIYLLLKTETFRNRIYSILFGISFASGFLLKWTFPVFLIFPMSYSLFKLIYENIKAKKIEDSRWLNVFLAVFFIFIFAGPWYIVNLQKLRADFAGNIQCGINEGDPQTFWASVTWYIKSWIIVHMRLLLLVLFEIGVVSSFVKKKILKNNLFILLTLATGFFIMVFYSNKDIRFIEPIMPFVAIVACYWVFLLPKVFKEIMVGLVILIAIFYFWSISFGFKFLPTSKGFEFHKYYFPLYIQNGYTVGPPVSENWHQNEIFDDILKNKPADRIVKLNMFYKDKIFFNKENFKYYILLNNYPIDIRYPFSQAPEVSVGDFLLVNSPNQTDEQLIARYNKILISQYDLSDNTKAYLFQVK